MKTSLIPKILFAALLPLALVTSPTLRASDHADGPTVAGDQAADLADCYMFPDPTDPSKIVLINTVRGFIVPGEAVNFALFDSSIRYRFQIENTEDARPDAFIDVSFSEKASADPQKATVVLSGAAFNLRRPVVYTGLATNAGLGAAPPGGADYFPATPQTLKDRANAATQIEFFAGETDDPFFFDIPGFARFRNAVLAGTPNPGAALSRGRDTFAGYNVLTIAFRLPVALLKSTNRRITNTTKFGFNVLAQRRIERTVRGRKIGVGPFSTVDREGLPAINALLVPLPLKNAYNGATTLDDARGVFAAALVGTAAAPGTLRLLGTNQANIDFLAGLAVAKGDILRIDTTQPTTFSTGNGRNPADDVVATLLTIISNSNTAGTTLDDSVPANDVAFATRFPYLGYPHQPREGDGTVDDLTRN